METIIEKARKEYHKELVSLGILTVDANGMPSNADKASRVSVKFATDIAEMLSAGTQIKAGGQTSGARFEEANVTFLRRTFLQMGALRPGDWRIERLGNRNALKTSSFQQYEHLHYLDELTRKDRKLASMLGNDYMIAPDIVVYRIPETDEAINAPVCLVNGSVAKEAAIRKRFSGLPILHASVSAKWTMRSDRAQNSRTEALGLIRNRKGHLPHISVITGEPMPSRLASLALGTGDIDCLYHFALYELMDSVGSSGFEESKELLEMLVEGKRLKDISDLPLDLAV